MEMRPIESVSSPWPIQTGVTSRDEDAGRDCDAGRALVGNVVVKTAVSMVVKVVEGSAAVTRKVEVKVVTLRP